MTVPIQEVNNIKYIFFSHSLKLYATGYGAGGRLGIGGTESVSTPTLLESIQHVFIKKVAVNSGGKHCLALSSEVKASYCKQKMVTVFQEINLIFILLSKESKHVCVGLGEVYTWGDNDEGQLGDGTTNAIQRPRLVAALQGKKINRVACGSAHTLAWSTSKPANAGKCKKKEAALKHLKCKLLNKISV
uniref:Uncharacterized protein n=1 Tax=Gopherus agassizii TaxID=38772 RepID=A0A452J6G6_9SAUR